MGATHKFNFKFADNGAIVEELDNDGLIVSTIVMESDNMPTNLGNLILDYIEHSEMLFRVAHITMQIK